MLLKIWIMKNMGKRSLSRIWQILTLVHIALANISLICIMLSHKCQFWAKFLTHIKISWFCKISSFAGQEWSNSWFQAKFSTRLKISGFCQISSSAGPEWSISFLSQICNTDQIFSGFCQISSFAGSEWSKLSFLSQIFNATENFWILPHFIIRMSWVVKSLKFCAKFSTQLKISEFCQLLSFSCSEWSKI